MKPNTRIATLLSLLVLAAIAAACGDEYASPSGNATDAAFIADMTTPHQGAIAMARIAQTRGRHRELRDLADDIINAQQGEISVMRFIRDDMHAMGHHGAGHMDMTPSEMGMDMDATMLQDAHPFDRAFIDEMIKHHEGAIAMARRLLSRGEQPALRNMARHMIDAQSEELGRMRAWRNAW